MSLNIHFTEENWENLQRNWTAWWAGELDRPLVMIESFDGPPEAGLPEEYHMASNFPLDMPADQVLDIYQRYLEAKRYYGDAWPKWHPNFGPGIMAGFLGARVRPAPETVWFEPSSQINIEDLHLAYDPDNVWWLRVKELTRAALERWDDKVTIGFTDLGGNLDVLASFRTAQTLLLEFYDAPEEVARLIGEITGLWLRYYNELHGIIQASKRGFAPWAAIWSPGRCYMLQSDMSYMISPDMFERYVLSDLAACCRALEYPFYHLDGKGQLPHVDMLLALEGLRGIQWIPGEGAAPPEAWLPLLKRIRDAGKLCQLYVTPEGAQTIVQELGGRGFAFYITGRRSRVHLPQHISAEAADNLLRLLTGPQAGRH